MHCSQDDEKASNYQQTMLTKNNMNNIPSLYKHSFGDMLDKPLQLSVNILANRVSLENDIDSLQYFKSALLDSSEEVAVCVLYNDYSSSFRSPTASQKEQLKLMKKKSFPNFELYLKRIPIALQFCCSAVVPAGGKNHRMFLLPLCKSADQLDEQLFVKLKAVIVSWLRKTDIINYIFNLQEVVPVLMKFFLLSTTCVFPVPHAIDPMLAGWLLDSDCRRSASFEMDALLELYSLKDTQAKITCHAMIAKADLLQLPLLWHHMKADLEGQHLMDCFFVQTMPIASLLAEMEVGGVPFDKRVMQERKASMTEKLTELEKEAHEQAGEVFLVSSNKQVADILYDKLKLPKVMGGNRGNNSATNKMHHSTNDAVLQKLSSLHVLPNTLIAYRSAILVFLFFCVVVSCAALSFVHLLVAKTLHLSRALFKHITTYMDPMMDAAKPSSSNSSVCRHHIFCKWNQKATGTGRLSSSHPNLQSLPKNASAKLHVVVAAEQDGEDPTSPLDTFLPFNIRDAFISGDTDCVLLSADYSQMEMRLLAMLSGCKSMTELFNFSSAPTAPSTASKGLPTMQRTTSLGEVCVSKEQSFDIYRQMASVCFGKTTELVTAEDRHCAKTISLGIVYGMGIDHLVDKLSKHTEDGTLTNKGAAYKLIEKWHNAFPGVKSFVNSTLSLAKKRGFVMTMANRKRYLPDINSSNKKLRSYAERQAVNSIIQGTASDIMKRGMFVRLIRVVFLFERAIARHNYSCFLGCNPLHLSIFPLPCFLLTQVCCGFEWRWVA